MYEPVYLYHFNGLPMSMDLSSALKMEHLIKSWSKQKKWKWIRERNNEIIRNGIMRNMNKEDKVKYFEYLVNSYDMGIAKIRGDHPKEVKIAIDSFFKAAKILVDHPEIGTIPSEYVNKLFGSHLLNILNIIVW